MPAERVTVLLWGVFFPSLRTQVCSLFAICRGGIGNCPQLFLSLISIPINLVGQLQLRQLRGPHQSVDMVRCFLFFLFFVALWVPRTQKLRSLLVCATFPPFKTGVGQNVVSHAPPAARTATRLRYQISANSIIHFNFIFPKLLR